MVRLQRSVPKIVPFVLMAIGAAAVAQKPAVPKFLDGDPLTAVPEVASAANAQLVGVDDLYDFVVQSARFRTNTALPSLGINTMGDVPNSSWFTNRHGATSLSIEELKKGARTHGAPVGPYQVIAAKTQGVTPGFRIRDSRGAVYFVKVDPPSNPEMATASDVIGALFLYAAGYNVAENYIVTAKRSELTIDPKASFSDDYGRKHRLTQEDLHKILDRVPSGPNGEIRLMASLLLEGKVLGPFRYSGVRSDDPNDLIPHEQRRDLRGLAVICAWLNHTDTKADNTMDTLVGKGEEARILHHLIDYGALYGSDSDIAKDPRHGQEFFAPTSKKQAAKIFTLGLKPEPWETVKYRHDLPATGNFTSVALVPATWKPNYPNPAFLQMNAGDAYWGAKIVASFTDEEIHAIVEEGRFSNPAAVDYIAQTLSARRDLIAKYWFGQVLPLDHPRIADGRLVMDNIGEKFGVVPGALTYEWTSYDDAQNKAGAVAGATAEVPSALANGSDEYIRCLVHDARRKQSVTVYFKRDAGGWKAVGLERT